MFRIQIDAARQFVSVRVEGFLNPEEATDYVRQIHQDFVAKIGRRPYVMLIDTTELALQSQEVVETFRTHIAGFPKATRIALVNGSSLARMQIRRVLTRDYARFFDTVGEAMPWLLENWPPKTDSARPAAAHA